MELRNKTDFRRAELFFEEKMKKYDVSRLLVEMKYTSSEGVVTGWCQYPRKYNRTEPYHIIVRVNPNLNYPRMWNHYVGTIQIPNGFSPIEDHEEFRSPEDAMVYVLGHEAWHFLCKTKQERGNWQTKANASGFKFLREFKEWSGPVDINKEEVDWL